MIPRVFHQYWAGRDMPGVYADYAATWTDLNPGWRLRQWTADDLPVMRTRWMYDTAGRYAAPAHLDAYRANLVRFEALEQYGGIWVDSDMECLRPIETLIENDAAFIGRDTPTQVQTAIIGAVAHHPFIAALLEGMAALAPYPNRKLSSVMVANRTLYAKGDPTRTPRFNVTVYSSDIFYPVDRVTGDGDLTHAYATHHPRAYPEGP